jgi:hypothetical protein
VGLVYSGCCYQKWAESSVSPSSSARAARALVSPSHRKCDDMVALVGFREHYIQRYLLGLWCCCKSPQFGVFVANDQEKTERSGPRVIVPICYSCKSCVHACVRASVLWTNVECTTCVGAFFGSLPSIEQSQRSCQNLPKFDDDGVNIGREMSLHDTNISTWSLVAVCSVVTSDAVR